MSSLDSEYSTPVATVLEKTIGDNLLEGQEKHSLQNLVIINSTVSGSLIIILLICTFIMCVKYRRSSGKRNTDYTTVFENQISNHEPFSNGYEQADAVRIDGSVNSENEYPFPGTMPNEYEDIDHIQEMIALKNKMYRRETKGMLTRK